MPSGVGALMPFCKPAWFIVGHPESSNHAAQLEELESLSDLVESLIIDLPRNIKSRVPAWDGRAFLLNNKSLRKLEILWQENEIVWLEYLNPKEEVSTNSMDILAKLQPPPNLESFVLDEYQGMTFPPWAAQHGFASALPNLVSLSIYSCRRCRYLPSMNGLECLKELVLCSLWSLEYIEENVSATPFCLPKLEKLVLEDLLELKGWCKGDIQSLLLSPLPRLSVLVISACPNLTVPPLLAFAKVSESESRVEEGLSPSVKVQIDDLELFLSLRRDNLSLGITNFNATESELSCMAELFRGMSDRLTYLTLWRCSGLKTLPGILQHLSTLRSLRILECPNFTWEEEEEEEVKQSLADGIQSTSLASHTLLKGISSLQELVLQQLPKMVRLPEGIQFLTSLQILSIHHCDSLQKMVRLECLKELVLCGLSSLEYIEENVSAAPFCLLKLEKLALTGLPELKGWCKGDTQSLLLTSFPRLSVLVISACPNLTVPPLLSFAKVSDLESRVEEGLSPDVEVHIDDLVLRLSLHKDNLSLGIRNFNATESELSYMAEIFRGMSDRLMYLTLWRCSGLKTLPGILQHLSTLRCLRILECPNFTWEEEEEKEEEKQSLADGIQSTSLDVHTSLKGLSSLQQLDLQLLPKMVRLPKGIQFLTSLQKLNIHCCHSLQKMVRLECLKELVLCGSYSSEYIEENVSAAPFCLPKLEKLVLRRLPELKGWCKGDIQSLQLSSFPCLSVLVISACPNLTVPPLLGFAKVSELESSVEEGLSPSVKVQIDDLVLSLSLHKDNLSLDITNFNATESALSYMAEIFRGMSDRLMYLHLRSCSGLKTLPGILQHLSTLRGLKISKCPNFMWEEDEEEEEKRSVANEIQPTSHDAHISWKGLSSLQELFLIQLPNMVRLPEGIQFLTSLQDLYIYDCDNLLIPEWQHNIFPYNKVDGGGKQIHLAKKEMDGCSSSTSI